LACSELGDLLSLSYKGDALSLAGSGDAEIGETTTFEGLRGW
jgi:hypothetical protein